MDILRFGRLCIVVYTSIYYDARPTKSQDLHCKTSKTDIPLQEDQHKIAQKQCGHLVQNKKFVYQVGNNKKVIL